MNHPKVLAIIGPTASGKSHLAIELANQLPIEIISLDSALVYQDMDIGTAKPSVNERKIVPHHLIDIISPLESYSAADFITDCFQLIQDIYSRGHLPLIVGGTMMYFHSLTQGLNSLPEADASIRTVLQFEKEQYGLAYLYQRLQQVDSVTAMRLDPNDSQRIERAIEIFMITGKPLSEHFLEQKNQTAPLDLCTIKLIPEDRTHLHTQIANRFHTMLKQGFVDEVEQIQKKYPKLNKTMTSMRCVGYRQAWDYLDGIDSYDTFVEKGIVATRQLSKRQLTWLRKISEAKQIDPYANSHMLQTAIDIAQQHFHL